MATKSSEGSEKESGSPKDPRRCHFLRFSPCQAMRCALVCEIDNLRAIPYARVCVWVGKAKLQGKMQRKIAGSGKVSLPPCTHTIFTFLHIFHCHVPGSCRSLSPLTSWVFLYFPLFFLLFFFFFGFPALALGEFTCACIRLVFHCPRGKGKQIRAKFPLSTGLLLFSGSAVEQK